jgi:hypothetical protein
MIHKIINELKVLGKEGEFYYYEPTYSYGLVEDLIGKYVGCKFSIHIRIRYVGVGLNMYKIQVIREGFNCSHYFSDLRNAQNVLDKLLEIVECAQEKFSELNKM